jgi:nucleoside-diphosphate-sugar epimerase
MSNVKYKNLDLSIEANYKNLFKKEDIVINCAALNGTQNFYTSPTRVLRNSAVTAILAAEFAASVGVQKYIYLGSSESYAGGLKLKLFHLPTPEDVPLTIPDIRNSRWSYGISKTIGEMATISNHSEFNLNYLILRLHNIYGPRMGIKHVIPDLVHRFKSNDGGVYGLNESRSFLFIEDFVTIFLKILSSESIENNTTYNIGSQKEVLIEDLAIMIKNHMKSEVSIYSLGNFEGSVLRRCPDTSRIRSQISYMETSLEIGISKTVDWYLNSI